MPPHPAWVAGPLEEMGTYENIIFTYDIFQRDVNAPSSRLGGRAPRGDGQQCPNLCRRLPLHRPQSHVPQVTYPIQLGLPPAATSY